MPFTAKTTAASVLFPTALSELGKTPAQTYFVDRAEWLNVVTESFQKNYVELAEIKTVGAETPNLPKENTAVRTPTQSSSTTTTTTTEKVTVTQVSSFSVLSSTGKSSPDTVTTITQPIVPYFEGGINVTTGSGSTTVSGFVKAYGIGALCVLVILTVSLLILIGLVIYLIVKKMQNSQNLAPTDNLELGPLPPGPNEPAAVPMCPVPNPPAVALWVRQLPDPPAPASISTGYFNSFSTISEEPEVIYENGLATRIAAFLRRE